MRKAFVALLLAGFAAGAGVAFADDLTDIPGMVRRVDSQRAHSFQSDVSAGSTTWVGHKLDPIPNANQDWLDVYVGGKWDFDTDIANTDSTQGVRRMFIKYAVSLGFQLDPLVDRPIVYGVDGGNTINEGNTNLWNARGARKFRKTGIAGAWHESLLGIGSPAVGPISAPRSAWCGLRRYGDNTDGLDELTGNQITEDMMFLQGGPAELNTWPGFGSQWDQLMYKDFTADGSGGGTVSFDYRTELNTFIDNVVVGGNPYPGAGWFNPNPTDVANFVDQPADSFMVYVGVPTELAYDTNRRWLDEIIDMNGRYQEILAVSGSTVGNVPSGALAYDGFTPNSTVRVVFRVKTNRARADENTTGAFNSQAGAAIIDNVSINGGNSYSFSNLGDITARSLAGNIALSNTPWVTTGKPPSTFWHVQNVSTLVYEDICGQVGSPGRICDLAGNVLLPGNHDDPDHKIAPETMEIIEFPTIDLANRVGGPSPAGQNRNGLSQADASAPGVIFSYDVYTGQMDIDQACFWRTGLRAYKPGFFKMSLTGEDRWSEGSFPSTISYNDQKQCFGEVFDDHTGLILSGVATIDSIRPIIQQISYAFIYNETPGQAGNTRGTYFDNLRVGFTAANPISSELWRHYQDQFPVDDQVPPGDTDAFDVLTANMKVALNIYPFSEDPQPVVPGDSLVCYSSYGSGNGSTSGVRMDFIFRIDPGPANYQTKGNRASQLVANAFWTSYKNRAGNFGKVAGGGGGSHGTFWDRNAWNSARMDSLEANLYPINNGGQKDGRSWQSTYHESEFDAAYAGQDVNAGGRATLAIVRNVCFSEPPTPSGIPTCDGSQTSYPGVPATTNEYTKILPSGLFTPGTHIEYFLRRDQIGAGAGTAVAMLWDTSEVFPHEPAQTGADFDGDRFQTTDVLPDMWKSFRYNGAGLACMLLVDLQDRNGAEQAWIGALDTLGFGKNNGAKKGWKGVGAAYEDPNNPVGFVAANLGQAGLNYDLFETRAAESKEGGHLGVRAAPNGTEAISDKSGPSEDMLNNLYSTVVVFTGTSPQTLSDNQQDEAGNDVAYLISFLDAGTIGVPHNVWLNGDGLAEDAFDQTTGELTTFLQNRMGVGSLASSSYFAYAGVGVPPLTGLTPSAPWIGTPGLVYGNVSTCVVQEDVLVASNGSTAASYQAVGPGPNGFVASLYRDVAGTPRYRTLMDGFSLHRLRGRYASLAQLQSGAFPGTDLGRHKWVDEVLTNHFAICARKGPVISVGDLPGVDGGRFANLNLGAFPNPAFANSRVNLRFTLSKAQDITVRIYNVAGREVRNFTAKGLEGPNTILWDGSLSNGVKATPGVYFYRIDGIDFGAGSAPSKVIFLSQSQN